MIVLPHPTWTVVLVDLAIAVLRLLLGLGYAVQSRSVSGEDR